VFHLQQAKQSFQEKLDQLKQASDELQRRSQERMQYDRTMLSSLGRVLFGDVHIFIQNFIRPMMPSWPQLKGFIVFLFLYALHRYRNRFRNRTQ
jgi:hypothetical protein